MRQRYLKNVFPDKCQILWVSSYQEVNLDLEKLTTLEFTTLALPFVYA